MSCGGPHETDCAEVLNDVWLYLDHECDAARARLLQRHLDECERCLERYGLEEHIKRLLHRKCGGDHAPDELKQRLRNKLRTTITEEFEQTTVSGDGTYVEMTRLRITGS
jgi:mycothiol system anti-sigma-R factor